MRRGMDRQIAGSQKVSEMPIIKMEHRRTQADMRQMRAHMVNEQGPHTGKCQIMSVMQIIEMERCSTRCSVMEEYLMAFSPP